LSSFIPARNLPGRPADYNILISLPRVRADTFARSRRRAGQQGGMPMKMPRIALSDLPDLDISTGLYGSSRNTPQDVSAADDLIIILMVFIYDLNGGEGVTGGEGGGGG